MVRRVIIAFLIFAIGTFVVQFIMNNLESDPVRPAAKTFNPEAYVNKDQLLGKIPRPDIPSLTLKPSTRATFSLAGNVQLPLFPPVVNVYELKRPREKLGDADRGRTTAVALGFSYQENKLADNVLYWETANLSRSLTFDKINKVWNFQVALTRDSVANLKPLETSSGYYDVLGASLLNMVRVESENFSSAESRVDFVNFDDQGELVSTISISNAKFVKVAVFRSLESSTLRENYRPAAGDGIATVFSPVRRLDFVSGIANFVVHGKVEKAEEDIVKFEFRELEYGGRGVYEMITAEEAWDKIQNNQGSLLWLKERNANIFAPYTELGVREFQADVTKTKIIYLEPENWDPAKEWTHFLQPYYLFEGVAILEDGNLAEFAFVTGALSETSYK